MKAYFNGKTMSIYLQGKRIGLSIGSGEIDNAFKTADGLYFKTADGKILVVAEGTNG